jgi:ATP-dependent helicase HrpB
MVTFDFRAVPLPVCEIIPEVQSKLSNGNTLIVSAPPGAGKSTVLPLALLDAPWLGDKKILMLEPRRLAAKTIATRMASLLGEPVGATVGYRIRFENRVGKNTRLEVLTEGILTRMLQSDNALEGVGMVIFDEFHERSIFADVALALCRSAQDILRPDLRIVVMSATLDMPGLASILKAPLVQGYGKQYPVEIEYCGQREFIALPEITARVVAKAVANDDGDILVFLPGEGEIRKCEAILSARLSQIAIHPLYGQLPASKQISALLPDKNGRRKIVLATSIAETSLTIEGVKVVVDTGYGRTLKFDPGTGLSRLATIEISKDSADQRTGRAGRLAPGKCYRLWSRADENKMADHRTPEILESDLAPMLLDMAQFGVDDIFQLTWLSPPPKGHLNQAFELLHELEALKDGKITAHGREMASLPCHPRIAHMLILARNSSQLPLATDVAAILEERDPLPRDSGIDINLRIEALRRYRSQGRDGRNFQRIEQVAAEYRKLFAIDADNGNYASSDTGVVLVNAYPERIACARPGNNAQFQLANGSYVMASHKDDLAHEPWLAVAHLDARDGQGKIFLASPLNPTDLKPMVKTRESVVWDSRKGMLLATKDLRIGSIVLQSQPLQTPNQELVLQAICNAIKKDGENLLDFNEDVAQWQCRVQCMRMWYPVDGWPDVSTDALLETNQLWLEPWLGKVRKDEDLQRLNLLDILPHVLLNLAQQSLLNKLAPQDIQVPSGSKIKLQYQSSGSAPVLAVRLQEMFGLADTPMVNNGRTPVLMHLLSPGYKPVQVTADLKSFWNNTYFEVRKELRARYPKHVWPDDPWTEPAIRGVKRRKS